MVFYEQCVIAQVDYLPQKVPVLEKVKSLDLCFWSSNNLRVWLALLLENLLSDSEKANKSGDIEIVRIVLPNKDQKRADLVRKHLFYLGNKIGYRLQPIFKSRKIENVVCRRESKPMIVNQQCVVYCFKLLWFVWGKLYWV